MIEKTVWDIYYENLKTGVYKVNDLEENLRFNLGFGLVYVINLGSEITKQDFSFQLAIKEGNIFFRTTKEYNNLKFTNTNHKIKIKENSYTEIDINDFERSISEIFHLANINKIVIDEEFNISINNSQLEAKVITNNVPVNNESPFSLKREIGSLEVNTTMSSISSPFKSIDKDVYNNLPESNKKDGELYLVRDGSSLEVDSIIKFKVINLRKQNGELIASYRRAENSVVNLPTYKNQENIHNDYDNENIYIINKYWREDSGKIVDLIKADRDKDIFLVSNKIITDKFYSMQVDENEQRPKQGKFNVKTDRIIFAKNETSNGFTIKPQSHYEGWSGEYFLFTFDFTIDGIVNKPGRMEIIPLKLTLYSDETYKTKYGIIDINIYVTYSSNSSTGD